MVVSSDAAQDLTESNKYPARLRGAISSGWRLACIIREINSLMIEVIKYHKEGPAYGIS